MTVQQEAINVINQMPDESVRLILELLRNMTPFFRGESEQIEGADNVDTSNRIGIAGELINDPEEFDLWDEEYEVYHTR